MLVKLLIGKLHQFEGKHREILSSSRGGEVPLTNLSLAAQPLILGLPLNWCSQVVIVTDASWREFEFMNPTFNHMRQVFVLHFIFYNSIFNEK